MNQLKIIINIKFKIIIIKVNKFIIHMIKWRDVKSLYIVNTFTQKNKTL